MLGQVDELPPSALNHGGCTKAPGQGSEGGLRVPCKPRDMHVCLAQPVLDVYKRMHMPAGLVGKVKSQTGSFCIRCLYRSFLSLCRIM